MAVLPTPSSASATGCTASGFGIKWFSSAYTCIDVEGPPSLSGWLGHDRPSLWVSTAQVSWLGAGTVCNWKMELRWTDVNGRVYRTDSSRVHVGCSAGRAVYGRNFGRQVELDLRLVLERREDANRSRVRHMSESGGLGPGDPCESIRWWRPIAASWTRPTEADAPAAGPRSRAGRPPAVGRAGRGQHGGGAVSRMKRSSAATTATTAAASSAVAIVSFGQRFA